jgi:AraC-like DNA-binding protein
MSRPREPEPPVLQHREVLCEGLGIVAVDFRCRAHVEPLGPEEPNPTHSIVFVRRGVFRRVRRREALVADPNHVLFFNATEPYRYSHPFAGGDDCTILSVEPARALDLVARFEPRDAERPEAPFRPGHALRSRRAARLHFELLALVRRRAAALALEDALAELADEALRCAYATQARRESEVCSTIVGRRRRELVEAAKLAINERPESPPSLGELARRLGCSPFHLSRSFHRCVGSSLRAYLGRLRTSLAAERLLDGARDLTALALDLGYADHSHFTNSFRREWGLPPSRLRATVTAR